MRIEWEDSDDPKMKSFIAHVVSNWKRGGVRYLRQHVPKQLRADELARESFEKHMKESSMIAFKREFDNDIIIRTKPLLWIDGAPFEFGDTYDTLVLRFDVLPEWPDE